MEFGEIPVVFSDENAVWSLFSSYVLERMPLRDVHYHDLNGAPKVIPELAVSFGEQRSNPGADTDAGLHMKPYLAIYILHCTDIDAYRATCRPRIKAWIETMDAGKQEWMILYVPALSVLSDSQHKVYVKIYEKLQSDLGAMTGVRKDRCTRFFSSTKKKYVCIDQLSANSDEFWKDAIRFIADFIGQSIETRIALLTERVMLFEAQMSEGSGGFLQYCVVKEGLAFLYSAINLPSTAFLHYEEMLLHPEAVQGKAFSELMDTRTESGEEISRDLTRYREKMVQGSLCELEFLEYIMEREKRLLQRMSLTLFLGQKFLSFIFSGIKLFKAHNCSERDRALWTYEMATYGIKVIEQDEPSSR